MKHFILDQIPEIRFNEITVCPSVTIYILSTSHEDQNVYSKYQKI